MNRTMSDRIAMYLTVLLVSATAAALFYLDTAPADAATVTQSASQPYGGCKEAYQAPQSDGARACRRQGWLIGPGYVVSPRSVLRYYNLPTCKHEDGSGQRRTCGWNVTEDNGNGVGQAYLAFTNGPRRDDTFVNLNVCRNGGCVPWVR